MSREFDAVIVGSGVKECLLSQMLACINSDSSISQDGGVRRVLVLGGTPTNNPDLYGNSDSRPSTYAQLVSAYPLAKPDSHPDLPLQGRYCFDASPLLLTRFGAFFTMIQALGIPEYVGFKAVETQYIGLEAAKIVRVPVLTETSALGFFEKSRFKKFASWVLNYNQNVASTYQGVNALQKTAQEVFKKFKLEQNTQIMIGHCMAGHVSDAYLNEIFLPTLTRVQEYLKSAAALEEPSTLVAPTFGSKGLIEGLVRKGLTSGVHFLLREQFEDLILSDDGAVAGVRCVGGNVYQTKHVICCPEVMAHSNRVVFQGLVSKGFAPLKTNSLGTNSCHVLFPAKTINASSDLHVTILGEDHFCAPKECAVVTMATFGEKKLEDELKPALDTFSSIMLKDL
eukprot:TRINITY_DN3025_c0_g1_i2.p1 TRINITY_DN3025_c0_g1~~TRINITY_DN3025_c0_g1_i2.p1  ORF type:complete len:397 (-),score=82.16 TRINITY_DN3025_c0_g1_i2:1219-2409(-)